MAELSGAGRHPAVLKLARTHVSLHQKGRITVVPLDQIDHVRGGKERGPTAWLVAGAVIIVLGSLVLVAAWSLYDPVPLLAMAAPVVGLLLGGGAIALYFMQAAHRIRIASSGTEMVLAIASGAAEEGAAFLRGVMAARTQYLEGVYEEEQA